MPAKTPTSTRDVQRRDWKFFVGLRDQHLNLRVAKRVAHGPAGTFFTVSWGKPRMHYVCAFLGQTSALRADPYPTLAKAWGAAQRAGGLVRPTKKGPQPRPYRGLTEDIRAAHKHPGQRTLAISGRMWQGNGCIYYITETVPEGNVVCDSSYEVFRFMVASRLVHWVSQHDTLREALGVARAASIRPSQSKRPKDAVPEGRQADQWLRFLKNPSR